MQNAQKSNPGFDPDGVLLTSFDLDALGYTNAQADEFDRQLLARVQQLPGVKSVTVADFSPLSFTIHSDIVQPMGYIPHQHESMEVDRGQVGPGYLSTMRTPLLAGREFTFADDSKAEQVAIVNKALVDRYWPGQNAIGKRIQIARPLVHCRRRCREWKVQAHGLRPGSVGTDSLAAAQCRAADHPCAHERLIRSHWRLRLSIRSTISIPICRSITPLQ